MFSINDWTTDPNEVPLPNYQGKDSIKVSPTEENNQRVVDVSNPETTTEVLKKGLNLTNTFLGYYDGSAFKSYISSTGTFKFNGDANNYITWNGSTLNIRGSLNADDISTGTLQSTYWNTTQGSQFNLNDGTFKLGGSANPKLSWDGSTLNIIGDVAIQNPTDVRNDLNVADSDSFAENIGYDNYQDLLDQATLNKKIINAGFINTDIINTYSLRADRLAPSTGTSTVWTNGGLVSNNFNGNPHGNIGSPTQGFRLSSDATGSTTDPNIYGATISAGRVQNVSGSNYINLDATGASSFLQIGNEVSINADGSGDFSRSLVTDPDVVASGVFDATYTTAENTYYIPTGVFDSNWNLSGANQPYSCRFSSYTGVTVYNWNSPYVPYHFGFIVGGEVMQHVGYTISGASTDEGEYGEQYELILKVKVKGLPYNGGNGGMYLDKYRVGWTLNRI